MYTSWAVSMQKCVERLAVKRHLKDASYGRNGLQARLSDGNDLDRDVKSSADAVESSVVLRTSRGGRAAGKQQADGEQLLQDGFLGKGDFSVPGSVTKDTTKRRAAITNGSIIRGEFRQNAKASTEV
jgi:hypothetical protein